MAGSAGGGGAGWGQRSGQNIGPVTDKLVTRAGYSHPWFSHSGGCDSGHDRMRSYTSGCVGSVPGWQHRDLCVRGVGWSVPAMACPLRALRRGAEPRTAKAGGVPAASLLAPSSLRTPLPDPSAKQTGPESWTGLPVPAGVQAPCLGTGSLWFSLTPGDSVARVTGHVLGLHAPQGARLPAWGWLGTVAGSEA